jgi:hypothetical protein
MKNHSIHVCCTSKVSNKFGLNQKTIFSYTHEVNFLLFLNLAKQTQTF